MAKVAAPDEPPFPDALGYLWQWFNDNSRGMSSGGMGYPTIDWQCLAAWSSLMRIPVEPWEADLMIDLSTRRANIISEKSRAEAKAAAK